MKTNFGQWHCKNNDVIHLSVSMVLRCSITDSIHPNPNTNPWTAKRWNRENSALHFSHVLLLCKSISAWTRIYLDAKTRRKFTRLPCIFMIHTVQGGTGLICACVFFVALHKSWGYLRCDFCSHACRRPWMCKRHTMSCIITSLQSPFPCLID